MRDSFSYIDGKKFYDLFMPIEWVEGGNRLAKRFFDDHGYVTTKVQQAKLFVSDGNIYAVQYHKDARETSPNYYFLVAWYTGKLPRKLPKSYKKS